MIEPRHARVVLVKMTVKGLPDERDQVQGNLGTLLQERAEHGLVGGFHLKDVSGDERDGEPGHAGFPLG
jgi:hypothetical protein